MTETLNPESGIASTLDGTSSLTPDLVLRLPAIFLFNRRGDRLHCFTSREAAVAYLRAAMQR